jgi:serine/threonine-protein kinase HipA
MTIKVWADRAEAGRLDRTPPRGSAFAYAPGTPEGRAISLTMPVRVASWNVDFGLAPIFDMNLPEGALRERLRLAFAKATGTFDDFDLLTIVGRSQIGRLRYTGETDDLDEEVPFQSVDEILAARRDSGLLPYLLERLARFSGISGVQPKILVRDEDDLAIATKGERTSFRGATHIVKFWEGEYPELATNEYFCLRAARRCGLEVPRFRLAEDGGALVIDRFDLKPDGTWRGFEDFAVLNGRRAADKYGGSYETSVLRRFTQFASGLGVAADIERLFTLIVLNCALRNGDAHLKNFGVVYDDVAGPIQLAPVFDVITTTAYLPVDAMALSLDGTTRWPSAARLQAFGETRGVGAPAVVRAVRQRVAEALAETALELKAHMAEHPAFREIGARMLAEWAKGAADSLGVIGAIGV